MDLAGKNRLIEELKERIVDLEETVVAAAGRQNNNSGSSSFGSSSDEIKEPLSKTVDVRLTGLEKKVARTQKDLGGLMLVYDDLQVCMV